MLTLLRQPKWIILTLLVPVGVALCLLAADWQYGRHVDRSAEDAQIRASSQAEPLPIDQVLNPGAPLAGDLEYRPVSVVGVFDSDSTVLVRRRVLNGSAGFWVVSQLRTGDGELLSVLRGWLPMESGAMDSPAIPPPPAGEVTVVGWLQPSQSMPVPAPVDLPAGQVAALDTAALAGGAPNYSPYLVASAMAPPDSAELTLVPVPNLGLGPHLAYAWQWLFFAALLPVGWVILARRELAELRAEQQLATDPPAHQPALDPADSSRRP
ncbi:MAG: hypothetical protein H6525_06095 [Actinobacteria bacterium]|nr:hypothetical protein [Actinomycetota bacterium]MCB9412401.1 hypothetical protein [Actinomycetota bacterium]